MQLTERLYWEDSYRTEFSASVLNAADGWCALSATAFYPGGGGQPHDTGALSLDNVESVVTSVRSDAGIIWHQTSLDLVDGQLVAGRVDWSRRYQLMKYHTLLHIVNTLMFDEYHALITGVDIGDTQARIDFNVDASLRSAVAAIEEKVNTVISKSLPLRTSFVPESEFRRNPRLVRTLDVVPPVEDGKVRTLEITGFDVQACGGTHVHNTSELGCCRIARVDNKGKRNKRLYVVLE